MYSVRRQIGYKTTPKSFLICTTSLSTRHSFLHEILVIEPQFKIPELKLFTHLDITCNNVDFFHHWCPPLSEDAHPVVIQQQTNTKNIPTTIANDPTHSLKRTEIIPTLTSAEGITNNPTKMLSTFITKPNSNVSGIQTLPSQLQDPQQTSSHSIFANIPEFLIPHVSPEIQEPELSKRNNTKRRKHQYRLCYKCRQTGHLQKALSTIHRK